MRFWLDLAAVEALGRHGRLTVEPKDLATARNGYEEIKVHRVLPSGSRVPRSALILRLPLDLLAVS